MKAPRDRDETPPPARKRRRWLRILAVVLLALPFLLVALVWLGLRTPSVRQAVLRRISHSFEQSSGIRARAADFSLQVRAGVLELPDVSLSAGDAAPFLTAERVRVEFGWRELFADPIVLRSVVVERPVADLRNPLPPASDEPPPRIDIPHLRLSGGRLVGAVSADDGEPAIREWSAEGVDIAGSYVGDLARLGLEPARLRLVRAEGPPVELEISSRLAGPLDGPWTIEDLKASGQGLDLSASGELGTRDDEPLLVRFELDADPAPLLAELDAGGHVHAAGEIDLRRFRGDFTVAVADFPSTALEPWIGEAARPGGRPSYLDLDAHFTGDPDAARQITGDGHLVWRQGDQQLAEAAITLADGRLDESGVVLESLVGDVHATARGLPAEFLRPWLGADRLDQLAARGTRLDLSADVMVDAAAPAEPTGSTHVVWKRGSEVLADAEARTLDGGAGELELAFAATLLPSQPGRRHAAGRLAATGWPELASGELRDTRLELELPDVGAAVDDARDRWPRLAADAGLELDEPPRIVRGALEATATISGTLDSPQAELDATWRPDEASRLVLAASGEPRARSGQARVTLEAVDLALLPGAMNGRLSGTAEASGSPDDWTASLDLTGADLRYGSEMPAFEELRLTAATDGKGIDVTALSGRTGEASFEGGGRLELARPLAETELGEARIRDGRLRLAADRPFSGIDRLDLDAALDAGVVHVTRLAIEAPTGPGDLEAQIPLGALRALDVDVDSWPVEVAEGRVEVDLGFPSLDLGKLALDLDQQPPWTSNVVSLTGRLWIDPADLTAAEGELLVSHWLLEVQNHRLEVGDDPILMALADRKLDILPVSLKADGNPVNVEGTVELAPVWQPGDAFADLVRSLDMRVDGVVEGGLLTPYLVGGVARGPLAVTAELSGPFTDLKAHATVDGPQAQLLYRTPYVTQIEAPRFELELADDVFSVSGATGRLNGGTLSLDTRRSAGGDWRFDARVKGARYRLDYGLTALLNANLSLDLPDAGGGRLAGGIEVERAVQRRDIDLNKEILNTIFAPPELGGAGAGGLDEVELDLTLTTVEGVRIKNNVADVHGSWTAITVQGTLASPIVQGTVEIDPGGYLFAYGQTARLGQGTLTWSGQPGLPPEIDLQPIWNPDDPALLAPESQIQQLRMSLEPEDQNKGQNQIGTDRKLVEGLAGFVGGKLGERLIGARVRIQPVLIFGETDPSAKLVLSRDLSNWVAFAVAVDLRDSQQQTYVLDVHRIDALPRVIFQVFTEEAGAEGVTAQQTVSFGRTMTRPDARRLHRIHFHELPEALSEKRLRRAAGFDRGDPLPDEADFEVEVNLAEHLRRRGYPGADVKVEVEPVGHTTADLSVAVDPGPHVAFEFEGEKPPSSLRRSVTEPYRVDFYEQASLDEVRQQMVAALRSQGCLEPEVKVDVRRDDAANGARTVAVRSQCGRRVRLERLVFEGIDPGAASVVESRFDTTVSRVELAAGVEQADEWLLRNLGSLGYAEARIASRRLDDDGRRLVVEIEPGPRQKLARVAIEGLPEAESADFLRRLPLAAGDVPRSDLIAAGNLLIRNDLRGRGYSDVQVRTELEPVEEGSTSLDLVYRVDRGSQYRVETIHFAGLHATRTKWARKVAGLDESAVLDPELLGQARRRLAATRLFDTVRTDTEREDDGDANVTFEVEESPRYQLAYGVRWENDNSPLSGAGSSVVVDVVNRNFLGRGITAGLRALYGDRDKAGRFYTGTSRLFGSRVAIDFFLERRREETQPTGDIVDENGDVVDDSFLIDTTLGSVQFSFPLKKLTSRVYVSYKKERTHEKIPLDPLFPFDEEFRFPVVGWQLILDRRDDKLAPTRGYFASVDVSATGDYIASDSDFVRLFTQLQWMRPFHLGGRRLVWAQSYRAGWLTTRQELFAQTDELFQAGGERSVRGYPRGTLPRVDIFADEFGGHSLLVINQEIRFPLWREISGLVFFDIGNAWADNGDFASDFFRSAGVGLRSQTPVGLLRLDVAWPLNRRQADPFLGLEADPTYKIYFGFGHAF